MKMERSSNTMTLKSITKRYGNDYYHFFNSRMQPNAMLGKVEHVGKNRYVDPLLYEIYKFEQDTKTRLVKLEQLIYLLRKGTKIKIIGGRNDKLYVLYDGTPEDLLKDNDLEERHLYVKSIKNKLDIIHIYLY